MSLGMSAAWRAMQQKQKQCKRCGLYYPAKLDKCSHCGDLDESGLKSLLDQKEKENKGNANLGRFFFFAAALVLIILLLSLTV